MLHNIFSLPKNKPNPTISPKVQSETASASPTNSRVPSTPQPQINASFIEQFIYPNSNMSQKSPTTLTLESSDNPSRITDWYKARIKSLNLNIQTFVITNTNGQVLNKLVSSNQQKSISIEIKKEPDSNSTQISVTLKGF